MILYKTVFEDASAEQIIEKSRFIAHVRPVSDRDEADAFIQEIKKKYKDATHNVPAMVIGDKFQIQWASDDGEPQGTSGAPIVQMLVKEEITNVAIVVTRYFGGIKLGTGGLVRAYTSSAKLGLEAAGLCSVEEMQVLRYDIEYPILTKIQNLEKDGLYISENIEYTDKVALDLICKPERVEEVKELLANITGGKGLLTSQKSRLVRNKNAT